MVAQSIVTIISTQCCHSDASNNNGQAYQPTSASLAPLFVYSISSNNATKTKSNNQEPNTTCRAARFKTECINRPGFPFPAGTLSLSESVCGCRDCTVLCETLQAARTMRQWTIYSVRSLRSLDCRLGLYRDRWSSTGTRRPREIERQTACSRAVQSSIQGYSKLSRHFLINTVERI